MNSHNLCFPQPYDAFGQGEDMCGRYASARKRIELLEEFRIERDRVTEPLDPDYNVAPTKPVYAVLSRAPGAAANAEKAGGARELRVVRWGLVPSWAEGPVDRRPPDQRAGRDRRFQAGVP